MSEGLGSPSVPNLSLNQILALTCGDATKPSYSFNDKPDSGLYCHTTSPSVMGISVNGVGQLLIGSTDITSLLPVKLLDVAAPSAPSLSTEGLIYKKTGSNSLYWNTLGGGELDLTTVGADNLGNHIATQQLQLLPGSAAAPGLTFAGDLLTGIFSSTLGVIDFTTNGNTRVEINSTDFFPANDNLMGLGRISNRWTEVFAANGVINTSDERQKNIISQCQLGLDFILDLEPIQYHWTHGTNKQDIFMGFSAQKTQQVLDKTNFSQTGMIYYNKFADVYGLRYTELIAPIVKAIQELDNKIKKLTTLIKTTQRTTI